MYVYMYNYYVYVKRLCIRVESDSNDPDNLGHLGQFLMDQAGLICNLYKLSGCDPDFLDHIFVRILHWNLESV